MNNSTASSVCFIIEPVYFLRFLLIVCIASPIAIFGMVFNLLLFCFFVQKRSEVSPTLYLGFLACLDFLISFCYVLLMGGDALAIYCKLDYLWIAWNYYTIPIFTLTRIIQVSSTYTIVAATMDRYFLCADYSKFSVCKFLLSDWGRRLTACGVLICAVGLRLSTVWEITILYKENCTEPFGLLTLYPTTLLTENVVYQFYDYYVTPTVEVFVPFAVLILLNFGIVKSLRNRYIVREVNRASQVPLNVERIKAARMRAHSTDTSRANEEITSLLFDLSGQVFHRRIRSVRERRSDRQRVRSATYTLLAIVSSYLVCNSFSLVVKILERVPSAQALLYNEDGSSTRFYTASSDLVSFLFMFNSFMRLFIYLMCNPELRKNLVIHYCKTSTEEEESTTDVSYVLRVA